MTLPSLCSAIRSQLYFSQIVAWCDLLRKGDPSVYESGRVIFANGNTSNAGDLAGHSSASASGNAAAAGAAAGARRPRLNIFYRIRPHDVNAGNHNDGGFSGKANVHNFPHVNIAENFSVAVCVKSLPRINGGLPHITPAVSKPRMPAAASTPTGGGGMCAATPTGMGARIVISTTPPSSAGSSGSSCDKRLERQRIVEEEALAEDDANHDAVDGHRERQLLKYRKRMLRRDKKRERKQSDQLEPMDEGGSEEMTSLSPAPAAEQTAMVMTLTAPRRIAMISTGTQTSLSSCQQCGSEKTLLCLNCVDDDGKEGKCRADGGAAEVGEIDEDDTSASEMEDTSSCSLSSSDLIVGTPRNKAELLLQAIQRTPKNRKPNGNSNGKSRGNNNTSKPGVAGNDLKKKPELVQHPVQNNNQHKPVATTSGCQVCKRQKTQHNFSSNGQGTGSNSNGDNSMEQEEEQVSEQTI